MDVLVADDHEFIRGGLVSELADIIPDASFLQAGNATDTLEMLSTNSDVALAILDLNMPGANGCDLVSTVCSNYPELLVIVLTASQDSKDMRSVVDCGASGYIPKTLGKDIVHHAVRIVLAGGSYFPAELLIDKNDEQFTSLSSTELQQKLSELTNRQREVLELLLQGNGNKQIASRLHLSENTVKIHVTAILRTLGLNSRAQVIAMVSS